MLKRSQLFIGLRFDLPTRPGHYFRLANFARPVKEGEASKWKDRIKDDEDFKVVGFVPCGLDEATHVYGWESYCCFPSIDRLLVEGTARPNALYQERWAFTQSDLDDPQSVKRDDAFLAFSEVLDEGIFVDRRGVSTGQYADGSFGITEVDAAEAFDQDVLHKVVSESDGFGRNLEESIRWREVMCDDEGNFKSFVGD